VDPRTQAAFVAQRMQELRDTGIPLAEMAVLYRAHFQSLEMQMELTVRGLPFVITSGLRFFEQAHIKDVAAFLRLVVNRRDEESFLRMVQLLPGCGPVAAEKLWREWLDAGLAQLDQPPVKWSETLLGFRKVPKKSAKHWAQLCYTLDELTPNGFFATPGAMIFSVMEGVYNDYMEASFDNSEARQADLEQLSRFGAGFENIGDFLEQLSLLGAVDGQPGADQARDEDKLTLSSIHQAKGLEWRVVFLIGLVDGQFPNGRVLETDDRALLEEERRLFYVAVTRARDELYLTYPLTNPKSYTGDIVCQSSRFLQDFPETMVEVWDIAGTDPWGEDQPF
jgi:DNA helicase-2/ATP-dependent DNA helicase PcrA